MKKRIKMDSAILSFAIILTGFLYQFPGFYPQSQGWDNFMDFLGLIFILKGTYLRMAARGYKMAHSQKGSGLVTIGLYQYMRNPMYLGSFLLGIGFVLLVWPWWTLPVFSWLFYARFKKQIVKEEAHLSKLFGKDYDEYCKNVPRLFPDLKKWIGMDMRECFPWEETWSTKEKRGLWLWPLLAFFLETFQEKIVFNLYDVPRTLWIMFFAAAFFAIAAWYRYQKV